MRAFSALFERDVAVVWTSTGTVGQCAGAGGCCARPTAAILCHEEAHVDDATSAAPSSSTPAARGCIGCPGDGAKLTPETSRRAGRRIRPDVHRCSPMRSPSPMPPNMAWPIRRTRSRRSAISAASGACGCTWTAPASPMPWCMLGCAPADLTWRAGVDALSFGFTKNGAMNAEAWCCSTKNWPKRRAFGANARAICSPRGVLSPRSCSR